MRKLITIEGFGDTSKIAKLLSTKLSAYYFFNKPPYNDVTELIPHTMSQYLNAFTALQFAKEEDYVVINKGFRSIHLQGYATLSSVGAYRSFEQQLKVLGNNKVERYHIFIIASSIGHANQMVEIGKCEKEVKGGKYIVVSSNKGSIEDIVDFIMEEL